MRVITENNTTTAHINNVEKIRSVLRDDIAFNIWQLVSGQQIWSSAAHIPRSENE